MCGGFRNDMLCRSEELNARESCSLAVVHSSVKRFVGGPRPRWKV
jgi:hypothetical protein